MSTPDPLLGLTMETLRARIGLTASDTAQDAALTVALATAVSAIEQYLDRTLMLDDYKTTFTHFQGNTLPLKAYPLESVTKCEVQNVAITPIALPYHFEADTGLLHLDGHAAAHMIDVEYRGGYAVLPLVLQGVLLATFDRVWPMLGKTDTAAGSRTVKAISVDGARTEFFDPNASVDGMGGIAADAGFIPGAMLAVLGTYRRYAA